VVVTKVEDDSELGRCMSPWAIDESGPTVDEVGNVESVELGLGGRRVAVDEVDGGSWESKDRGIVSTTNRLSSGEVLERDIETDGG
jgi:hypothetical protein